MNDTPITAENEYTDKIHNLVVAIEKITKQLEEALEMIEEKNSQIERYVDRLETIEYEARKGLKGE